MDLVKAKTTLWPKPYNVVHQLPAIHTSSTMSFGYFGKVKFASFVWALYGTIEALYGSIIGDLYGGKIWFSAVHIL